MYKNYLEMPLALKFITLMGFVAPALAIASTLTGSITQGKIVGSGFGAAENITEFSMIVIFSLPSFFAAMMILMRLPKSRYIYVIGWITICLSPLALSQIRTDYDIFLVQLSFNLILGVVLAVFLFRNESINNYFIPKEGNLTK